MIDGVKVPSKAAYNATRQGTTTNTKSILKAKTFHATANEEKKLSHACVICAEDHTLYQCKKFEAMSPPERTEIVQTQRLCFNCLLPTHTVKKCRVPTCCRRCGRRHHTTLHYEKERETNQELSTDDSKSSVVRKPTFEEKVVAHFAQEIHSSRVLLATARVRISSPNGRSLVARALIDQGSEASFMTEAAAQSLGLKRVSVNGIVSGVGENITRSKNVTSFNLESLHSAEVSIPVRAFVLKTLTSFLPTTESFVSKWPELENLPLADPKYGTPEKIDLILGAEIYSEIITDGLKKCPMRNGPVAQNTLLGWIISGKIDAENEINQKRVISLHVHIKEDECLKQFWEIEREPDAIGKRMTQDEVRCEEIFEQTTTRDDQGRYIVRLPFKGPNPECLHGKSKQIAMRKFKLLERKLIKNPKLYEEYVRVMEDYLEQNHMEKITNSDQLNDPNAVYLPHHAVVREDKQTTKVRAVYDASCKGINNVSLNDNLLVGPKLQQDLRHILMRWRCHPICVVADLVKMYRQIKVHYIDTDFQRILWRPNPESPIEHYKMTRLTFGTACAPYLAVKCLQQLAKDESQKYPEAAKITLQDFYMDDLLTGAENEDIAIKIYDEMSKLMKAGGFELQKWCTNSEKLIQRVQEESRGSDPKVVFKSNDTVKVLGIAWNKATDKFEYTLKLPEEKETVTKRQVLSDIARLYDPLGWIAPCIIRAKVFMQKLWRSRLEWDEDLTAELLQEWNDFRQDLSHINHITVPRWMQTREEHHKELHVFADASKVAYAAAVYIKSTDVHKNSSIHLVTAKTKVVPVEKEISIPRMELCAALLAAKLIYEVSQIMNISQEDLYAWTDSKVVLAWIAGEPSRWSTFVSNRVSEILTMLNKDQWRHVSTHENPADCASRGIPILALTDHHLWWQGPDFLRDPDYEIEERGEFNTTIEERPTKILMAVMKEKESFIWTRFSNLERMLRVLSYCMKILKLRLPREQRDNFPNIVTTEEMNKIFQHCIKKTQGFYFKDEIKRIRSRESVPKKSLLHTLSPFLDENGILRVGGRIQKAEVELNRKHPIIMPSESHLTMLIVNHAHLKTLHGGPQIMLNYIRSKYWIIHARELAKRCYRTCLNCVRYSGKNHNPLMGNLPEDRVNPSRPFKISGVDFTGFINIRFSPGRGSKSYKGYICLFICMASKAIHLEAVSDLSAQGFIAAFRRFVSRRGHCKILYSDNGTNFVGADKSLKEMFNRSVSQVPDEISQLLANDGTSWKFIPPHAPNFGGLWEAGVRSTKTHLKRVIGDSTLTFEELTTVLTQIEACLNSRPLSYLSEHPDDPLPLTPSHFLVGEPLIVIPDDFSNYHNISGLQRWKYTQKMVNDFWRKWSDEYLVTLNQRSKWTSNKSEPEINDIVIVKDHNLPPAKWLLGKIVQKHTGEDNVTRVVTVKTKTGLCKRPCNKLCFLDKSES